MIPIEWNLIVDSQAGVRPAGAYGDALTPGNNTKGAWVQILTAAEVVDDLLWVEIEINSNAVSAAIRDGLVDIGLDYAGGTSYTVFIADLVAGGAPAYTIGVYRYVFPVRIPAGASVAARASVNNVTVGTMRVRIVGKGRPSRPFASGGGVQTLGAVTATSEGTAITPGGASEGALVSVGSLTFPSWWFQLGVAFDDTSLSAAAIHFDVCADNTPSKFLIRGHVVWTTTAESATAVQARQISSGAIAAGTTIYVRARHSGTADTTTAIVYAVY